ncbi:MAG TPA: endonuclease MutS2 [Bacteroidota bacterium]|nr:endonuclease MutS2 [Bacteroidota bacterium]
MSRWENALRKLEFDKVRQRLLRYAGSDPGRASLASMSVMTSRADIAGALARVSEMKRLLEQDSPLPLEGIHPLGEALGKTAVEGMTLLPRELLHVSLLLKAARLSRAFASRRREEFPLIWQLAEPLRSDKILEFNIDHAVDEGGGIRPDASRELLAVRRSIADRYDDLRRRLAGILRSVAELGFSQDDIITTREGRMVIPVKSEHKHRVPGFIHSASASGATVFIEPTETLELNNEIRSLQFQEQREIERILRELTSQVGAARADLAADLDILAALDDLQARAKYSIEVLGVEPELCDEGALTVRGGRHPLLLQTHGYDRTVPLDLDVGGEQTTLLISGPNAGGKSVAMKTVGLLVAMAQSGLHVPAGHGTRLRMFRSCYVDIGDEQSIENDLSTFSSHLASLKEIASGADSRSLVLIDEIGAGTDPSEGGAIAASLLEELTRRGAVTIATTHQGALKVFAHETQGVSNGAMEFDLGTLTPTYRFRPGVPGSSYALEMASRLGFAPDIMRRARERLGGEHAKLETLIIELEEATQRARAELALAEEARRSGEDLAREYREKLSKLTGEARETRRKAADEAARIIAEANAAIERSVREIRETNAEKDAIRRARADVVRLQEEIASVRREAEPEGPREPGPGAIAPGSHVTMEGGSDAGEVLELSPDGKTATVVFGAVRMRVPSANLRATRNRPLAAVRAPADMRAEKPRAVQTDLDIRGMTGEEALPLVDKFIDDAVLAGLGRIDIIHGKGTGALRKKVTEFLSSHPRVSAFRPGEWNEGGMGATVVELKGE